MIRSKRFVTWFSVALRPQRRVGLLGTGTEWGGGERVKGSTAETARKRPERPWTWVLWLNVPVILYRFHKVTFFNTITNTCFMRSLPLCALFSRASFWRHQSFFGVTDRTPEAITFAYRSRKKCFLLQSFLSPIVFFFCPLKKKSFWGEILITHCSVLKNKIKGTPRQYIFNSEWSVLFEWN